MVPEFYFKDEKKSEESIVLKSFQARIVIHLHRTSTQQENNEMLEKSQVHKTKSLLT